ncbi:unnamed protein product, partial [Clonostachys rhizophaga]
PSGSLTPQRRGRSSRIPSPISQQSDRRHFPFIHINKQPEDPSASQNVLQQLAINIGNTGETASVAGDTNPVAVAESSSNTQASQQTAASSATEEVNHVILSSSVTGAQTTAGPAPMLSTDGTGQGPMEESTGIPGASRGSTSVSVSDQGVQTEMEKTTSPALVESVAWCDGLENTLGLLVVKMLAFLENASPPSTTRASSASSTSDTTQTSYDVHPVGAYCAANEPCQKCIKLKERISLLEEYLKFQQESQWKTNDNLTEMVEGKDRQATERIDHIETRLENVSTDLQRVETERDIFKTKATYLQGKLSGHHHLRGNARRARRFTKQNRHALRDFNACIQKVTAQLKDTASQLTVSPHPEVQRFRHEQQIDADSITNIESRRLHLHQQAGESRNIMRNNLNEKEVAFLLPNDIQSPQKEEQGTSSEVVTSHIEQPKANTVTTAKQEAFSNTNRKSKILDSDIYRSKAKVKRDRKPQSRCVKLEAENYGLPILDDALSPYIQARWGQRLLRDSYISIVAFGHLTKSPCWLRTTAAFIRQIFWMGKFVFNLIPFFQRSLVLLSVSIFPPYLIM